MNFDITGKLYEIFPTQQKTEKFRTREFVLETSKAVGDRVITDYVKFQSTGDKCDLLNRYKTGDTVTVHFNIRGNRWEKDGKVSYFTNLDAWRIEGAAVEVDTDIHYQGGANENNGQSDYNDDHNDVDAPF